MQLIKGMVKVATVIDVTTSETSMKVGTVYTSGRERVHITTGLIDKVLLNIPKFKEENAYKSGEVYRIATPFIKLDLDNPTLNIWNRFVKSVNRWNNGWRDKLTDSGRARRLFANLIFQLKSAGVIEYSDESLATIGARMNVSLMSRDTITFTDLTRELEVVKTIKYEDIATYNRGMKIKLINCIAYIRCEQTYYLKVRTETFLHYTKVKLLNAMIGELEPYRWMVKYDLSNPLEMKAYCDECTKDIKGIKAKAKSISEIEEKYEGNPLDKYRVIVVTLDTLLDDEVKRTIVYEGTRLEISESRGKYHECLNLYSPFIPIWPSNVEYKQELVDRYIDFLDYVFTLEDTDKSRAEAVEIRRWLCNWFSGLVKSKKLHRIPYIWSVMQGSGKNTILAPFEKILGDRYRAPHEIAQIMWKSALIENSLLILADECTRASFGKDRDKIQEFMKAVSCNMLQEVNHMGKDTNTVQTLANFMMMGQTPDAVTISNTERRFTLIHVVDDIKLRRPVDGYFREFYTEVINDANCAFTIWKYFYDMPFSDTALDILPASIGVDMKSAARESASTSERFMRDRIFQVNNNGDIEKRDDIEKIGLTSIYGSYKTFMEKEEGSSHIPTKTTFSNELTLKFQGGAIKMDRVAHRETLVTINWPMIKEHFVNAGLI
jgi:hypothetical protein